MPPVETAEGQCSAPHSGRDIKVAPGGIIDHVHQAAGVLRFAPNRFVRRGIVGGGDDQTSSCQIAGLILPLDGVDLAVLDLAPKCIAQRWADDDRTRAGLAQGRYLAGCNLSSANDHAPGVGQIYQRDGVAAH